VKLHRLLIITRKTLLETVRDPILMVLILGLPAFFLMINYFGYGHQPKAVTYPVWVLNLTNQTNPLLTQLQNANYPDGRPMFHLFTASDRNTAEQALQERSAAALLVMEEKEQGLFYTIRGDALNMNFVKASVQIEAIILPWLETQQGKPQTIKIKATPLNYPRPSSEFETYVPGMMVFAILLLIPQTAMLIGRERRWGTLERLELSLLKPVELLAGLCLAQLLIAAVQIVIMFAAALALGFQNRGSLLLALLIGLVLALSSIGVGLLVGVFMRSDTDALNTGSAVSMLQVFLSGAFFAMPGPILFTSFHHPISAFDFLPATHVMLALQQVLSGGAGFEQISFRLITAFLLSMVYFLIGVWVFQQKK
jgi:ABC-2 type transport system permease protein